MFFLSQRNEIAGETLRDEQLLLMSIDNPGLFSEIVRRYEKMFVRKASSILKNKEDAEDAAQDAFLKIYRYAANFKEQDGASFKSWAFKILLNTCFTKYEERKKAMIASFDIGEYDFPAEEEGSLSKTWLKKDILNRALCAIPETMRKILTLHYIDEKPQKDIAFMLSMTPQAVRVRIHRAKKELQKVVREQHL